MARPGIISASMKPARIRLIPANEVSSSWVSIRGLLLQSKDHWQRHYTLDGIYERLKNGTNQFWVAKDEEGPFLGMLTSIEVYETGLRVLRIIWLGGEELRNMTDYFFIAEEFARARGCSEINIYCRPAIMRLLRKQGFKPEYNVISKNVTLYTEH